jgi:hypothetical protein
MSVEEAPAKQDPGIVRRLVPGLALIGLLAILAFVAIAVGLSGSYEPPRPAQVAGAAPETVFTVGNVQELEGGNLIRMDITASGGRDMGSGPYSGGSGDEVRNILLLDRASGTSRKLLPDNERRIAASHFLAAETDLAVGRSRDPAIVAEIGIEDEEREETEAPAAYYALEVEQPGNSDRIDLLVGILSDGSQAYVMRGLDGIDSVWMHSPTQIGLIVRERLQLYYRIVDIPSMKILVSKRIDIG